MPISLKSLNRRFPFAFETTAKEPITENRAVVGVKAIRQHGTEVIVYAKNVLVFNWRLRRKQRSFPGILRPAITSDLNGLSSFVGDSIFMDVWLSATVLSVEVF